MMQSDVVIRLAVPADAAEIANVHLNCWREAYTGLLPQEVIDRQPLTFRNRRKNWETRLLAVRQHYAVFVAEAEQGVVGFCSWEPARDTERFPGHAEISALYLLAAYQKQGIGKQLVEAGKEAARGWGYQRYYAWVLSHNPSANFYTRMGMVHEGACKDEVIGGLAVVEHAHVATLSR